MTTSGLVEFLLSRLAEDEAVAKAAHDGIYTTSDGHWNIHYMGYDGTWPMPSASPGDDDEAFPWTIHASRHDPARVLADVAAKRQIVSMVAESATYLPNDDPDDPVEWNGEVHQAAAVLKALAQPYADHDQFREEWRV